MDQRKLRQLTTQILMTLTMWREAASRYTISEWFKSLGWCKKKNGTAITVTTQKNAIKKTFGKWFAMPLDFDYFKHPVYPYGLKEDLIVKVELHSSEKFHLCSGDTSGTDKLSDISLEYDA